MHYAPLPATLHGGGVRQVFTAPYAGLSTARPVAIAGPAQRGPLFEDANPFGGDTLVCPKTASGDIGWSCLSYVT